MADPGAQVDSSVWIVSLSRGLSSPRGVQHMGLRAGECTPSKRGGVLHVL